MNMLSFLLKYLYLKFKWYNKLSFHYSCNISISSTFEGMNKIHSKTSFNGSLGYGSYIGSNCCLSADIGRFTSIAPNVRCNPGIHPYTFPFLTTSPSFYSLNISHSQNGSTFATEQLFEEMACYDKIRNVAIKIGSDCWIGEGVFIAGGVRIGNGAIVLAHAVVTKDIPDYAIVGGVPARILKYRYDIGVIKFLNKIKWWDNSPKWFKNNWKLLSDFESLKSHYYDEDSN